MRDMSKKILMMTAFLLTMIVIYTAQPSRAELIVDELSPHDVEVTGKVDSEKDILIHFDSKWYRTKSDEMGIFKQTFPKKIGYDSIEVREISSDGFSSQKIHVSAQRAELSPPVYLGTTDGKRRFYSPDGYQVVALLNGKVYSGEETLEVDATIADEAKVYASNGTDKSGTISIDFNHPPKIPFTMNQSRKGESFEISGRTLPRLSMAIQVKDETGTWQSLEYFSSDLDGDFEHDLSQDIYRKGDEVGFRVHVRNLGADVPLSDELTKQYTMEASQLTSENPVTLFNDERIRAGRTVEGRTKPGMRVHAQFEGITNKSILAGPDGKFSLSIPSNVSSYPYIVLAVFDSKGIKFGEERYEMAEADSYGWQIQMDKITSDSRELTGVSRRYSKIYAHYSDENTKEYYTVSTSADSRGKFSMPIPRHIKGFFTIEGEDGVYSSRIQKIGVVDVRPLATPDYVFENGEMIVTVKFPKSVELSVEVAKIKGDGTFDSSHYGMIRKSKNDDIYEAKIPGWNDGDRFSMKLTDGNDIESSEVSGEYEDVPLPTIDELTDDSLKISGQTVPGMMVSVYGGSSDVLKMKSDSLGRFEIDISERNSWNRPTHLSVENTILKTKRILRLQYRDTTPPTLSINPVKDSDSTIQGTMYNGDRLELTIYYWDGRNVSKEVPRNTSTGIYYRNETDFRDVEKIELRAIDSFGNTRKETIIPIDTHYPRIEALDIPVQGDNLFLGLTDRRATVTIMVNSKEYVSTSSETGFFSIETDRLVLHDRVTIKVEDRGKNVTSQIVSEDVVGVMDARLSVDRKTFTVKTNLKQRLQDVRVVIEADGRTFEKEISKSLDFSLPYKLKNHSTVKIFLIRLSSGEKTLVVSKKFSDTTPPDINTGLILRDDLMVGDHLYGKAEIGSLVELYYKGKVVNSYGVTGYDSFDFLNRRTFHAGEKFVLRITDAAGNKSEKTLVVKHVPKKPQIDAIYDVSKAITGKTEPGLTVEVKVNQKKYLVKANSKGLYRLDGKGWIPGYTVVVKAKGKEGIDSPYERRTVTGTIKTLQVKNITSTSRFVEGKTERDSYVQVFKNGKSISKKILVSKDGKFKLSIPRQAAKTKLVVKVERRYYKTLEKTFIVSK